MDNKLRKMNARRRGPRHRATGFTLVELLVTIAIVTILATTALFAMWGVQEDAKAARTRSQIAKINQFVMEKYESYRTRPIRMQVTSQNPRQNAFNRLQAMRELMRMEMPDRRSDLLNDRAVFFNDRAVLPADPQLWRAYRSKVTQMTGSSAPWPNWSAEHQSSECLYLILSMINDGDTSALDFFMEGEIQDTDGDGIPEVLDGWGRPIAFLRWAPGYVREASPSVETPQTIDASESPDPFDPVRADPRWGDNNSSNDPYMLIPLIYSAGKDQIFDVFVDWDNPPPLNDPYSPAPVPPDGAPDPLLEGTPFPGSDGEFNHGDNITNHFTEVP